MGVPATTDGFGMAEDSSELEELKGLLFQNAKLGIDQLPPLRQPVIPAKNNTTIEYRNNEIRMASVSFGSGPERDQIGPRPSVSTPARGILFPEDLLKTTDVTGAAQ